LTKSIEIIVPVYNEELHIARFFKNISEQSLGSDIDSIVFIVAPSTDNTLAEIEKLQDSRIRVLINEKRYVAFGLNAAIRNSSADYLVRMDVHSEYPNDYIEVLYNTAAEFKSDNCGGYIVLPELEGLQAIIGQAFVSKIGTGGSQWHNKPIPGPTDSVPFGFWRRDAFEKYGLFEESLIRNQDDEHNYRINKMGGKVIITDKTYAAYFPRRNFGALFKQYFQFGLYKVLSGRMTFLRARHYAPSLFVSFILLASFFDLTMFCILCVGYIGAIALFFPREKLRWIQLPAFITAVITMHISYGIGFLCGHVYFFRRL